MVYDVAELVPDERAGGGRGSVAISDETESEREAD